MLKDRWDKSKSKHSRETRQSVWRALEITGEWVTEAGMSCSVEMILKTWASL